MADPSDSAGMSHEARLAKSVEMNDHIVPQFQKGEAICLSSNATKYWATIPTEVLSWCLAGDVSDAIKEQVLGYFETDLDKTKVILSLWHGNFKTAFESCDDALDETEASGDREAMIRAAMDARMVVAAARSTLIGRDTIKKRFPRDSLTEGSELDIRVKTYKKSVRALCKHSVDDDGYIDLDCLSDRVYPSTEWTLDACGFSRDDMDLYTEIERREVEAYLKWTRSHQSMTGEEHLLGMFSGISRGGEWSRKRHLLQKTTVMPAS